jgi:sirohydrochlorin cobaltochelatase
MGFGQAEVGYGGAAAPLAEPALRHAATLGFKRVVVFPYFLFTGVLVKRVYTVCDRVAADHPEIEILKAPYLSDHPLVLDCLLDRVTEMI